ncbi:MAG: hypothetical protein JWL59_4693 [Chthoniobacteraceae bacterium]|nr:hypothetical protein [Chthoniobacteraceae bacterium]
MKGRVGPGSGTNFWFFHFRSCRPLRYASWPCVPEPKLGHSRIDVAFRQAVLLHTKRPTHHSLSSAIFGRRTGSTSKIVVMPSSAMRSKSARLPVNVRRLSWLLKRFPTQLILQSHQPHSSSLLLSRSKPITERFRTSGSRPSPLAGWLATQGAGFDQQSRL